MQNVLDDPLLEAALIERAATLEQLEAIAGFLAGLPGDLDPNRRMTIALLMIDAAAEVPAAELWGAGRRIVTETAALSGGPVR